MKKTVTLLLALSTAGNYFPLIAQQSSGETWGTKALMYAVKNNQTAVTKALLSLKVDPNEFNESENTTPLLYAAAHGYDALVEKLIAAGADVHYNNCRNTAGDNTTALGNAAREGHLSTLKILIEAGANVNREGVSGGMTPLMYAAKKGHLTIVTALISAGAEVNLRGRWGMNPLMYAAENGYLAIVKTLISAGAGVNLQYNDPYCFKGKTALLCAVRAGFLPIVSILLAAGAQVNLQDDKGSVLMHASKAGYLDLVKTLIAAGADVNAHAKDVHGRQTALYYAAAEGHIEIAQLLISSGASPNICNENDGLTPLMWATKRNSLPLIRALLTAKANAASTDKNNKTTLDYAQNPEITQILREAMPPQQARSIASTPTSSSNASINSVVAVPVLAFAAFLFATAYLVTRFSQEAATKTDTTHEEEKLSNKAS
jgi:ankyrin repeat protein